MGLIITESRAEFDTAAIKAGDVLYGRHSSWDGGKAGVVTGVTADELVVQFHPGIGNVVNHFFVPAAEVADQEWELRWSSDLISINEYGAGEGSGNEA